MYSTYTVRCRQEYFLIRTLGALGTTIILCVCHLIVVLISTFCYFDDCDWEIWRTREALGTTIILCVCRLIIFLISSSCYCDWKACTVIFLYIGRIIVVLEYFLNTNTWSARDHNHPMCMQFYCRYDIFLRLLWRLYRKSQSSFSYAVWLLLWFPSAAFSTVTWGTVAWQA